MHLRVPTSEESPGPEAQGRSTGVEVEEPETHRGSSLGQKVRADYSVVAGGKALKGDGQGQQTRREPLLGLDSLHYSF